MKKIFSMFSILISTMSAIQMSAQVAIGSLKEPHAGAVLELVSGDTLGLLLPQLSLANAEDWSLSGEPIEGMLVYNTSSSLNNDLKGKGIYVWTGNKWQMTNQQLNIPCSGVPDVSAISATGPYKKNTAFRVSIDPVPGAKQYQWETEGVSTKGISNTYFFELAALASGTLTIKVTVDNACGSASQNKTIEIEN
jgi:hypothetical protein